MTFRDAMPDDAEAINALHQVSAADLTTRFGRGHWSNPAAVRRVEPLSAFARHRVGEEGGRIVSAIRLQTKKPWAIDVAYFTPVQRPIYLTGMVVDLAHQGRGVGRAALEDAHEIAKAWPAQAIRLDAYDAEAGAGAFYVSCGYSERGRVVYRTTPLIYYERLLANNQ